MNVEIVDRGDFVVVGMKYRGRNEHEEIPALWGQFMPRLGEIASIADSGVFYGVMGNYDMAAGEFDYVAGAEVLPDTAVPEGMARWDVPPGTYAVIIFPFSELMEAIDHIHNAWLPASGYRHTGGPEYEYYGLAFEPEDRTDGPACRWRSRLPNPLPGERAHGTRPELNGRPAGVCFDYCRCEIASIYK
jgi:AraC family transcriptional regulator